jgi:hypothetical protein
MYHKKEISKGKIGEVSKILEEVQELQDAFQDGDRILQLIELSDIVGAIKCFLENYFNDFSIEELIYFANKTNESFKDGTRK